MAGERPSYPSEVIQGLSNRRLMYEALVTGLRWTSDIRTDASRRIRGETEATGPFSVDDYYIFELQAGVEMPQPDAYHAALEARRPIINICCEPDENNVTHTYLMLYPEDLHENGYAIRPIVQAILPQDWPASEPVIFEVCDDQNARQEPPIYHCIVEPFTDSRLSAVYNTVVAAL